MNSSPLVPLLVAQIANWRHLGDGLHRGRGRMDPMDLLPYGIGLVVLGVLVAVVLKIRQRNDMSLACDDPQKLFRQLSLAHGLDRSSQNLLRRLAQALQLEYPGEVFLKPAYYQTPQLPASLRHQEAELQALRERLFK